MQKHLQCKKLWPSKVESYLEVNTWTDWQQQDMISKYVQGLAYYKHINTTLDRLANLLSTISCYKFHMYFKRLRKHVSYNSLSFGHLFIYSYIVSDKKTAKWQIIVTFIYSFVNLLKYEICNRIWLKAN